jgi:methyl-accepting chemotaxis protein
MRSCLPKEPKKIKEQMIMIQAFRNLKMGIKIFGGFSIVLILLILVAIFGYNGLESVVTRSENKEDVAILVKLFLQARQHEKNYIMKNESADVDRLKNTISELNGKASELKRKFNDKDNKNTIDRVSLASNRYEKAFEKFIDFRNQKQSTMTEMRQKAKNVRNACTIVEQNQVEQLKNMREENARFIKDKITIANDVNRLLEDALNAKSKRILLMQGNFEPYDEWKEINKQIFMVLKEMRSKFKLAANIQQTDTIVSNYQQYEYEVISYVEKFKKSQKSIEQNATLALKAIENIENELKLQLQKIIPTVGIGNVVHNSKLLQDRLKKADDANQLIQYVINAKSLRISIVNGELDKVKTWKDINRQIFKLTENLKKRFQDQRNISLADVILERYRAYENEMLAFIQFYEQSSKKMIQAAITAMKAMETIRDDQKNQLSNAQKTFELNLNEKITTVQKINQIVKWFIDARKNEKEVIISKEKKYIDMVNDRIKKILDLCETIKSNLHIQQNIDKVNTIIAAIQLYIDSFNHYLLLSEKQDSSENHMLKAALNAQKECNEALKNQENKMVAQIDKSETMMFIIAFTAIILGLLISFVITKGITRPVIMSLDFTQNIAKGDFCHKLDIHQQDELGDLANALNKMIENVSVMLKEISTGIETVSSSSTELSSVSEDMSKNSQKASDLSNNVATAADEMSSNMSTVAAAVEQTSANVSTVASAAEEMTATINEIASNTEKAHKITNDAVVKTKNASDRVNKLGIAAKEIGTFTETITDISEQTNLLALNATIESARAGDAGKGFAVVANEIKELAKQTSIATEEIRNKIDDIQQSTSISVKEIISVTKVIEEVNEIVGTIAAAIEQQSAATKEIASNVAQASVGTNEVSSNVSQTSAVANEIAQDISNVNMAAKDVSQSSTQVSQSAVNLSELSEKLNDMVKKFKV